LAGFGGVGFLLLGLMGVDFGGMVILLLLTCSRYRLHWLLSTLGACAFCILLGNIRVLSCGQ
jgi:hypothetical protein